MRFQATTNVTKALAVASKIAETGTRIVLEDAEPDSYTEKKIYWDENPAKDGEWDLHDGAHRV